jgi:sirohydrochlorin cobaltochelatase
MVESTGIITDDSRPPQASWRVSVSGCPASGIGARIETPVLSSLPMPRDAPDVVRRTRFLVPPLYRFMDVSMFENAPPARQSLDQAHDQAVLLMAHGSRDAEAREEYRRIHAALVARLAPDQVVFSALEFPGEDGLPSIQDGWRLCREAGARRVVAVPFFLFPAGHVREDLPTELRAAREAHGWADLDLLPPLGAADELLDAVEARAHDAVAMMDTGEGATAATTALILVGAGTSDPDANGDLCKAARLLWERFSDRYFLVEAAWVSLTRPSVADMVDRCVRLGAKRIALVPYFLNTGVLLKRIDAQLAKVAPAYPAVAMARGHHIGPHPRLLDLLERRIREAPGRCAGAGGVMAVCGRPSCMDVATGRMSLSQESAAAR